MTTSTYLEIRDRVTLIPALAITIAGDDDPIARYAGFGDQPLVALINLATMECHYDPHDWTYARSLGIAHAWIAEHFRTSQLSPTRSSTHTSAASPSPSIRIRTTATVPLDYQFCQRQFYR